MTKVLHLYAGNLYGGIETFLSTLARCRHFCPAMEPSFGLCFRGRIWNELGESGVAVHDMGPVRWSRPWTVLRARKRLKSIMQNHQFDAVATHANWPHAVFAPVVRRLRVPLANFVHDALRTMTWIDRLAATTKPDLVIANSHYSAKFVPGVFFDAPTKMIYLPVDSERTVSDPEHRRTLRRQLKTSEDATVIIQVSRMESWKGAHRTISALGLLKDCGHDWTAWIVGGAQRPEEVIYENHLKDLVRQFDIEDRVRFLGQRNDVPRLLSAADIFCQPNTSPEPFGIVFIEALSAGVPVVTTNMGGGAEIVNDHCGRIVTSSDIETLVQAISSLFAAENRPNPEVCMRRAIELCDAKSQLTEYHHALTEMVAKLPKAGRSIKC